MYAYREALPVRGAPIVAAVLATQGPDIVDKPLAWTFAVLPTGRSLGHSLWFAGLLITLGWYIFSRRFGRPAIAVGTAFGYISHLVADGLCAALAGQCGDFSYLAWPLFPLPAYETEQSFAAHFAAFEFSTLTLVGFGLSGLAALVWLGLALRDWTRGEPRRSVTTRKQTSPIQS